MICLELVWDFARIFVWDLVWEIGYDFVGDLVRDFVLQFLLLIMSRTFPGSRGLKSYETLPELRDRPWH